MKQMQNADNIDRRVEGWIIISKRSISVTSMSLTPNAVEVLAKQGKADDDFKRTWHWARRQNALSRGT